MTHDHEHPHGHGHHHQHEHAPDEAPHGRVLTIRSHSGLSGDMLLTGLALMNAAADREQTGDAPVGTAALVDTANSLLAELLAPLAATVPALEGCVRLVRKEVAGIGGWHAEVRLPEAHEHRSFAHIRELIEATGLTERARRLALDCFALLARCEAEVHGKEPDEVCFHEVGALDSILDICLACALFDRLAPARFVVGPLPLADGSVLCAHGHIPAPAPAVLALLSGVPVRPFAGAPTAGELVTPTALALLRTFGCDFGPWPAFRVTATALVYGSKVFPGTANGAVFAVGMA
ncbi:MAG: LarC family nickel insertion protein [Desulfovibrio sp.]|uniref:nickel insertion protein n=1 Tax=Desulfovibrio sp. TaxID=885 RepID=UPI001A7B9F2F|nr:nickel insertion protein [Desulfovibrio sp.]MBD5416500.1 LarC family nickel insertion protein [Desulfovibrio sp.]